MIQTKRPPGSNRIAETSSYATPLQLFRFDNQGAACEINGETIADELERRRNGAGSLVQNLRAGFVPPEPP
jgi:hypothetical protein